MQGGWERKARPRYVCSTLDKGTSTVAGRTKPALTRESILGCLRERQNLLHRYSVRRIALFGSYAKGAQRARSDIDLLVEFGEPTYDNLLGLSRALERVFRRRVEVLTPEGLESIRVRPVAESIRQTLTYA